MVLNSCSRLVSFLCLSACTEVCCFCFFVDIDSSSHHQQPGQSQTTTTQLHAGGFAWACLVPVNDLRRSFVADQTSSLGGTTNYTFVVTTVFVLSFFPQCPWSCACNGPGRCLVDNVFVCCTVLFSIFFCTVLCSIFYSKFGCWRSNVHARFTLFDLWIA